MANQTRGKIPDLEVHLPTDGRGTVTRRTLYEVKTIHFCKTRYKTLVTDPTAKAVDRRAKGLEHGAGEAGPQVWPSSGQRDARADAKRAQVAWAPARPGLRRGG